MTLTINSDKQYREYLFTHIENVKKAFNWLYNNTPKIFENLTKKELNQLKYHIETHDASKYSEAEFGPYKDHWFGNGSYDDDYDYDCAWLHHVHNNPHHWQHWVIVEAGKRTIVSMPKIYIIEMICDWWSFSWTKNNLYEMFTWYELHGEEMVMSESTREKVNFILKTIKDELDKQTEVKGDLV